MHNIQDRIVSGESNFEFFSQKDHDNIIVPRRTLNKSMIN